MGWHGRILAGCVPLEVNAPHICFHTDIILTGANCTLGTLLEHVDLLEEAYEAMRAWLKPDGFMSHQIDFKCHGTADEWNGHWTYSDLLWKFMRGKRPWFLNRQPHSVHLGMLEKARFKVVYDDPHISDSGIDKKTVARSLRNITDDDLVTSSAFIVSLPDAAQ